MTDTLIALNPETCPCCGALMLNAGTTHECGCLWLGDIVRHSETRQVMLWDRVRPSLGSTCPRKGCGLEMATWTVEHIEMQQCACGYAVRSTEGGLKWAK